MASAEPPAAADTRAARLQRRLADERQQYEEARAERLAAAPVLEDLGELGKAMDTARWRRRVGAEGTSVFVMTGYYPDVRNALFRRGWKQNPDAFSPHFDLAFTLKPSEVDHRALRQDQAANHFAKAGALTTKAGLLHSLRCVHWFAPVDPHSFFPRAYDLADGADFTEFANDFRGVEAEKAVRAVVVRVLDAALDTGAVTLGQLLSSGASSAAAGVASGPVAASVRPTGGGVEQAPAATASAGDGAALEAVGSGAGVGAAARRPYESLLYAADGSIVAALCQPAVVRFLSHPACAAVNLGVLAAALSVLRKRCREWDDAELDDPTAVEEPLVTAEEWQVLRYCDPFTAGGPAEQAPGRLQEEAARRARERALNERRDRLIRKLKRRQRRAGGDADGGDVIAQALRAFDKPRGVKAAATAATPCAAGVDAAAAAAIDGDAGDSDSGGEDDDGDDEEDDGGSDDDEDSDDEDSSSTGGGDATGQLQGSPPASPGRPRPGLGRQTGPTGAPAVLAASKSAVRPGAVPLLAKQSTANARSGRAAAPGSGPSSSPASDDEGRAGAAAAGARVRPRQGAVPRGAAAGVDAVAGSGTLGDPAPTLSAADEPALRGVAALPERVWRDMVAALATANAASGCQTTLNGCPPKNVWIVKPAGKSRGRGIECEDSLSHILNRRGGAGHQESHWIVQKYLERPLLISGRKWDIRQWVLVTSWNPLTVYFYDRCYLRFCSWPYDLGNLQNRYIHLSNNSVQKHSAAFDATDIEGNMWHMATFAEWLQARAAEGAWDGLYYDADEGGGWAAGARGGSGDGTPRRLPISGCADIWAEAIQPQLRRIVTWSLQSAQGVIDGHPGSFQLFGYDFMVDASLRPWLIEVNSSPDLSYSTPVTEELVRAASEDLVKVVVDMTEWEAKATAARAEARAARKAAAAAAAAAAKAAAGAAGAAGAAPSGGNASAPPAAAADGDDEAVADAPAAPARKGRSGLGLPPPPDTGGFRLLYKAPVTLGRPLTCTATDMVCVGKAIHPPTAAGSGAGGGALGRASLGLSRSKTLPPATLRAAADVPASGAGSGGAAGSGGGAAALLRAGSGSDSLDAAVAAVGAGSQVGSGPAPPLGPKAAAAAAQRQRAALLAGGTSASASGLGGPGTAALTGSGSHAAARRSRSRDVARQVLGGDALAAGASGDSGTDGGEGGDARVYQAPKRAAAPLAVPRVDLGLSLQLALLPSGPSPAPVAQLQPAFAASGRHAVASTVAAKRGGGGAEGMQGQPPLATPTAAAAGRGQPVASAAGDAWLSSSLGGGAASPYVPAVSPAAVGIGVFAKGRVRTGPLGGTLGAPRGGGAPP